MTWPGSPRSPASTGCGSTWTAPTATAGLFAPSIRARYDGIEHADSFILDPHKWLFAPFDCAALLYRDPSIAKSVHKQDAWYLDVIHDTPGEWNPTDYAYHLTRRARGLPLWFSLAVYGVDRVLQRPSRRRSRWPANRGGDQDPGPPGTDPRARTRRGALPPPRLEDLRAGAAPGGRTGCCRTRWRSSRRRPGKARPWPGSPSCTRTPRWTWCGRSWTGWTDPHPAGYLAAGCCSA